MWQASLPFEFPIRRSKRSVLERIQIVMFIAPNGLSGHRLLPIGSFTNLMEGRIQLSETTISACHARPLNSTRESRPEPRFAALLSEVAGGYLRRASPDTYTQPR